MNGPKGDQGEKGSAGPRGPPGQEGPKGDMVSGFFSAEDVDFTLAAIYSPKFNA